MPLAGWVPDIVHALHARRGGACALPLARALGARCVVTLTGTDATHDLHQPAYGPATRAVIEGSDALVALRPSQLEELARAGVAAPRHTVVIPQGIALGEPTGLDLRGQLGIGPAEFVALLPGGLRPVKAQHVALGALELLAGEATPTHLVLAGPTLDAEYADLLRARAAGAGAVHFVGTLPHAAMAAALAAADVVLNTSESEGESNALLEAQWAGRPVIARRNHGNVALVTDGVDGWLFDTPEELAARLTWLRAHPAEGARVAAEAQARVRRRADPGLEASRHLALYRLLLAAPPGPEPGAR